VSCALLYVLARRLGIGRVFAIAAVALFAFSPLAVYFHRLVLIDNPAITFLLAALVLALSPSRRLWLFAASGVAFTASVLSKETMLLFLPVLILAVLRNADRRTRRYCLTVCGALLALTVLIFPVYAALKGELLPGPKHVSLIGEASTQLFGRKATGSIFDPTSQTYGTVTYWLHLDPWLLWSAVLTTPIALARRATRLAGIAFLIQCVMVLRPGYLPFMFVIAMLPFAALVVAGSAETLWCAARDRLRRSPATTPPLHGRVESRWSRLVPDVVARHQRVVVGALAATVLVALLGAFSLGAAPGWTGADRAAMTLPLDGPERQAKQWLLDNVDHGKRILVADDFWVFLVEHGYDDHPVEGGFFSRKVVFYWPFDFDPAVRKAFPEGWKNLDYVVSTEGMRNDTSQVVRTAEALRRSRLVVSFGRGDARIGIRQIVRPPIATGDAGVGGTTSGEAR
jgi:hypothetical protein